MIEIFTNELHSALNAYDHGDSVQKAISIFKADNTTVYWNNKKDGSLTKGLNIKLNNNLLKYCNISESCNRE